MKKLKYELQRINMAAVMFVAILLVFVNVTVWCVVGSPVYTLHFISARVPVLPLWLYGLLDFFSFALLGVSLGTVLGEKCQTFELYKYRGGFYFVIGATLAYLHHAFFFSCHLFFISFLIAVLQCCCFAVAIVNFSKISKISVVSLALGSVWGLYLTLFSLVCFLFM